VAMKTYYYDWGFHANNQLFPETLGLNFMDYEPDWALPAGSGLAAGTFPSNFSLSWHVPENIRGAAASGLITGQKNKYYLNDPAYIDGRSLSTHIVLKGTYFDAIQDELGLITLTLYPGLDNLSDFNIVRNTKYEMTATISQLDADDNRIAYYWGPFVTYIYYYYDYYYGYLPFAKDYDKNVTVGSSIVPDQARLDLLQNHIPDFYGTPPSGYVSSGATTVNVDNRLNIVHVYYD